MVKIYRLGIEELLQGLSNKKDQKKGADHDVACQKKEL